MLKIVHTDQIKALETRYWDAHYYLQICIADPHAKISDRRECLAAVKAAFDALCRQCWSDYRKRHGETMPMDQIREIWKDYITDTINLHHTLQQAN